jgi:PKD repeat protein
MRKRICILLPVLLVIGLAIGCGDDPAKPTITRLYASETCGVAPLRVDFRGDATGGEPLSDPSGSNNWLKFTWDFGDGTVIDDGTSIAYHQYDEPGEYIATIVAEDDAGERASRSIAIEVKPDSLIIEAFSRVGDNITTSARTCEPVSFFITAEACDFDPVNDSTDRYVHRWHTAGSSYRGANPVHFYTTDDIGEQMVTLLLEDPVRSITRADTITVNVTESAGADLSLQANWRLTTPDGVATELFERNIPAFPDTLTVSYVLTNAGPEIAYRIEVLGNIDGNNRINHLFGSADLGSYVFDGQEDDTWTWYIEAIEAGVSVQLDISFTLDQANVGNTYVFPATMTPYPCDQEVDDDTVAPLLEIIGIP